MCFNAIELFKDFLAQISMYSVLTRIYDNRRMSAGEVLEKDGKDQLDRSCEK